MGNNFCSSSFGDTVSTITTPRSSTLHISGKGSLYFKIEVEISHAAHCAKPIALIKVLIAIFYIDSFEQ